MRSAVLMLSLPQLNGGVDRGAVCCVASCVTAMAGPQCCSGLPVRKHDHNMGWQRAATTQGKPRKCTECCQPGVMPVKADLSRELMTQHDSDP